MKKLAILAILAITFSGLQPIAAQGYKKEKLRCYYRSFPKQPLDKSMKTFSCKINPGKIDFRYIEKKPPLAYVETGSKTNYSSPQKCENEYLTLYGYEKVPDNGDVIITLDFTEIQIVKKEPYTEKRRFIENKQGVDRLCYNYKVTYNYGAVFTITSNTGNIIYEEKFYDPNEKYVKLVGDPSKGIGSHSFTQTDLMNTFNNDFMVKYQKETTKQCLAKAEKILMSEYSYPIYYANYIISTDKSTKKLNYDDLNKAVAIMIDAFKLISDEEKKDVNEYHKDAAAVEACNSKLDGAIEIWKTALQEANYLDKKARIHRKLAPMLYCNIATAYIFQHNWDMAMENINMAMEHKESAQNAKWLMNFMTNQKERYEINGVL